MLPEIIAWKEFSKAVEDRLEQQNDSGYEGWDGEYPTEDLQHELTDDAILLERGAGSKEICVDIAARAMMLYRRLEF